MNYLEALSTVGDPEEGVELKARRFLASQAIMLALKGVPGIYFHSLVGSKGWPQGVATTGRPRTINREKVSYQRLETELLNPGSLRHNVFQGYIRLLGIRSNNPAFHPGSDQSVLELDNSVFAILRSSTNPVSGVLCLHNVSDVRRDLVLNLKAIGLGPTSKLVNLISGKTYLVDEQDELTLTLRPYGYLWLAGT
jgi:sucrose phosphorylase